MKRFYPVLPALLSVLLAACAPNAREPDSLALARVLGVDGAGPVEVTAVCGPDEDGSCLRGSAEDADFQRAKSILPWTGEKELALTSLSWLVIGSGADLEEVAWAVLEDHELSPGACVWYTDDAAEILNLCEDPATRLAVLEEQGVQAPTAAKALAALETDGSVELPRLIWDGERMQAAGTYLWGAEHGAQ